MEEEQQPQNTEFTARQALFIQNYLNGQSARQAAVNAGYSQSYADTITGRLSLNVRKTLVQAFIDRGLTEDYFADKEKEILDSGEKAAMNTALTRIYKVRKDLTDKSEIEHKGQVEIIKIQRGSDVDGGDNTTIVASSSESIANS